MSEVFDWQEERIFAEYSMELFAEQVGVSTEVLLLAQEAWQEAETYVNFGPRDHDSFLQSVLLVRDKWVLMDVIITAIEQNPTKNRKLTLVELADYILTIGLDLKERA